MTVATTMDYHSMVQGLDLLGEVVAWDVEGLSLPYSALTAAMSAAGLDASEAKELLPQHAFSRACRKLADERIIRKLSEDANEVRFQFTKESRMADELVYTKETTLTLSKTTGKVACDLPGLATLAQEELDHAIGTRTAGDVTRIVNRTFKRNGDLFPIRRQGGCYLVPQRHVDLCERVQDFLRRLGRDLSRLPIPSGTKHGDKTVQDVISSGLAGLIQEYAEAVEAFDAETRPDTLERCAERIKQARFKIDCYAAYIGEQKDTLLASHDALTEKLKAKVAAAAEKEASETTDAKPGTEAAYKTYDYTGYDLEQLGQRWEAGESLRDMLPAGVPARMFAEKLCSMGYKKARLVKTEDEPNVETPEDRLETVSNGAA